MKAHSSNLATNNPYQLGTHKEHVVQKISFLEPEIKNKMGCFYKKNVVKNTVKTLQLEKKQTYVIWIEFMGKTSNQQNQTFANLLQLNLNNKLFGSHNKNLKKLPKLFNSQFLSYNKNAITCTTGLGDKFWNFKKYAINKMIISHLWM